MDFRSSDEEIAEDQLRLQLQTFPLDLNFEEEESDDNEDINETFEPTSPQPTTTFDAVSQSGEDTQEDDETEEEVIDLSVDLPPTPVNLLKLNLAYQEVIEQEITKVKQLLQENHCQTSILIESEQRMNIKSRYKMIVPGYSFMRTPFFKDKEGNGPTNIEITRRASDVGELFERNAMPPGKWKKPTLQALISGVEREARRHVTEPLLSKLEYLNDMLNGPDHEEVKQKISEVQKQIDEKSKVPITGLLGDREREWDWDTIANIDLDMQATPANCACYWKSHLHPSINNDAWSKAEEKNFTSILEKHTDRDWNWISKELNTGRTPLQCAQYYQRTLNKDFKRKPWTPEEDQQLVKCIHRLKVGNCIPYTMVALNLNSRTNYQVVHRWSKTLDPFYKKTRWEPEEDGALLRAVSIYGEKWARIRDLNIVPNRHDGQLRERYKNCLSNWKRGPWIKSEDRKLLKLVHEHGERWSLVARYMGGRTDSQCVKRFNTIKRAVSMGRALIYNPSTTYSNNVHKIRKTLLEKISAETTPVKTEKDNDNDKNKDKENGDDGPPEPDAPTDTPHKHLIKISSKPKQKVLPAQDALLNMSSNLSSREVLELYIELMKTRRGRRGGKMGIAGKMNHEDIQINFELKKFLEERYKPMKRQSRKLENDNLGFCLKEITKNSKSISSKDIFIYYIKALNINAARALESIRIKKDKQREGKVTLRSVLRNEIEAGNKAVGEMRKKMSKRNADSLTSSDITSDNTDITKQQSTSNKADSDVTNKSRAFARNLYLPLCAPNRATTKAYYALVKDRERRVTQAKTILRLDDATDETSGGKFKTVDLLADMRARYDYKVFRSRFNALFTWSTFLRSLVPYRRTGNDRVLRPAIRIKRPYYDVTIPSAKRHKPNDSTIDNESSV
nr:snRNA-activating protein complex subunit 4 isoform X1 [Ciona intestinalis]|eukprot:XP_002124693.1 snRNA-activating protein complex subunit 4 isoform X1 [Ciona intestinalis]